MCVCVCEYACAFMCGCDSVLVCGKAKLAHSRCVDKRVSVCGCAVADLNLGETAIVRYVYCMP